MSTTQTTDNQLEIGQVIYCISNENGVVYPVQVVEEVVHKSITGTKKSYTVRLDLFDETGAMSTQLLSLDGVEDRWFPTLETAREFLTSHFQAVVDELITNAEKLSSVSFVGGVENAVVVGSPRTPSATLPSQQPGQPPQQLPAQQTPVRKKPTVTLLDGTTIELDPIE